MDRSTLTGLHPRGAIADILTIFRVCYVGIPVAKQQVIGDLKKLKLEA